MATPIIAPASFTLGEVAPALFGRVDTARLKTGASTMRNIWCSYRGGAYSRAGTAFVGYSKQTGRTLPPRLIPFQFAITQGLALEFGNFYMRVIFDGAQVTENVIAITGVTQANPAVVTAAATGGTAATPNNGGVVSSYAPGEHVTLAGGTFTSPMVLGVTSTTLLNLFGNVPGHGYAATDTIHLAGGTQTSPAIITLTNTKLGALPTIANAGSGGTDGTGVILTGTTGAGTLFQVSATIAGGVITSVDSITVAGAYTTNPTVLTAEPVTGGGLSGAQLSVVMGVGAFTISSAGTFTANPVSLNFTQASTSGGGTGATFFFALMGISVLSVVSAGVYTSFPANPVSQASSTGSGLGATFTVTTGAVTPFANGDWVFITGVSGMTQLNGRTFVVAGATLTTFQLNDVFGNTVNSTAYGPYVGGGTAARIYTLATIYAEADLPYLKFTQSADVMTICCVNPQTGTEYPPQNLSRLADDNWTFSPIVPSPSVFPPLGPGSLVGSPPSGDITARSDYAYEITSVDSVDGTESVASPIITGLGREGVGLVDIAAEAGTITVNWDAVTGITQYNVYKATPNINSPVPNGSLFGYAGSAFGTQWVDNNITPDFSQTPPQHKNPFARGQVIGATVVAQGTNYSANPTITINTATGTGAKLSAVVQNTTTGYNFIRGPIVAFLVLDPGQDYLPTDTITITDPDGTGASATLDVGAQTGTYPSVPAYFQERLVLANTLNNTDTYYMSQPGAFSNFDSRIPTIDSDAIIGTPWSVEVNGIQFMVSMPGGLVVLTGLSAWQLTGVGGSSLNPQPITPASQQAQPQAYNGCSATVPPIRIDYDILFLQSKGTRYRDLAYQYFQNIYTGTDLTVNSTHLFDGFTIKEHAWCEEPYRLLWSVRSDGAMLSFTFLKSEQVQGFARHDTQGTFESVCSITELPIDALYIATQRNVGPAQAYFIERMDNRIWAQAEDAWCVDCGLTLPQNNPSATLSVSSATGLGACSGVTELVGGVGYSAATTATVVDDNGEGPGSGAVAALTIVGGVITAVSFTPGGTGYVNPALNFDDPAGTAGGSGASATITLDNSATFTASAAVFGIGSTGDVIRADGGMAVVTAFIDTEHVTADILSPLVDTVLDPNGVPLAVQAGNWSLDVPSTVIGGLWHLIGTPVTGLADGNVVPPQTVAADGTITLLTAATVVTLGLPFQAQLQSLYLDAGEPTVQGQRKAAFAVTVRMEASRGIKVGANQVDGSTTSPPSLAPTWEDLVLLPENAERPYNAIAQPLFTGDARQALDDTTSTRGQVAVQQDFPLPMAVLALIPEIYSGDTPQQSWPQPPAQGRGR